MYKLISKVAIACVLLVVMSAASQNTIPTGSKVFVSADDGFDTYLTAALQKKKVQLMVVTDKAVADYELQGVSDHEQPGILRSVLLGQTNTSDRASVKLVNLKTSAVVFAYVVNRTNTERGQQSTAESCAKHLKAAMANQ